MSSKEVGIEEARKRLGDLVTAARQGTDIILTRNGKPAARIVAIEEPAMTVTTATTYGSEFSKQEQIDGIYAYINGGEYTSEQENALADALLDALNVEVDKLLGDVATWHPSTSEFLHRVDGDIPDREEMRELFSRAWTAVEARYDEIEAGALA